MGTNFGFNLTISIYVGRKYGFNDFLSQYMECLTLFWMNCVCVVDGDAPAPNPVDQAAVNENAYHYKL